MCRVQNNHTRTYTQALVRTYTQALVRTYTQALVRTYTQALLRVHAHDHWLLTPLAHIHSG